MKTSNKLLIIALAFILAGTVFIIIKVKQFMNFDKVDLSGTTTDQVHNISDFNRLDIEGAVHLEFFKGTSNKLTLTADTALLKYIVINQTNDKLEIKLNSIRGKRYKVEGLLEVENINIEELNVNAGASFKTEDTLKISDLDLNVNAGGNAKLIILGDEVDCDVNAGGFVKLLGEVNEFSSSAVAGGNINASNLISKDVKAETVAGGFISVHASESLDASCSAGGQISYSGNPNKVSKSTNSGGGISKVD
jgi:hypothetical protein